MVKTKYSPEQLRQRVADNMMIAPEDWIESRDSLLEAGLDPVYVFPVVRDFRGRVRQLGNILAQMANGVDLQRDGKLMVEIRRTTAALSYLLNCSSFEDNELHDYDKAELDRKLGRL